MKKRFFIVIAIIMVVITALINMGMNTTNFNSLLCMDRAEALGVPEFVIKPTGFVGIFNENPLYALEIGNNNYTCVGYIHGLWMSSSDSRIKENIKDLSNSLDIIGRLRGVSTISKAEPREKPSLTG
jgi:hypothetical protein